MSETTIRLIIATVSLFIGIFIGYFIWHRRGDSSRSLSALQILSVFVFFGYIVFEAVIGKEPSDIVATAILSMVGGEVIGKVIANRLIK